MARIHQATLQPTKLELLRDWLPGRPWARAGDVRPLGAYRFDDPDGEVGVETFLLATSDGVVQVPLTYRGAPLDGAEDHQVGTTEHSVLGTRWVYDGCADRVWAATLTHAILTGGTQADEVVEVDGVAQTRTPTATVEGSGRPGTPVPALGRLSVRDDDAVTVVEAGRLEIGLARLVGTEVATDAGSLSGRWDGSVPVLLAGLRTR